MRIADLRFDTRALVAGWAIVLSMLVHIDWHVGRPTTMRLSLGWSYHWVLGGVVGVAMARFFLRRFDVAAGWRPLLIAGFLGFVLGQGVQPALEVIGNGVAFATAVPPVRWTIFVEFALAWTAGAAAALVHGVWSRRLAESHPGPH